MFFYKSLGNSFLILGEGVDIEDGDCRARYTRSQRQLRDGDCHTRPKRQLRDGDCHTRPKRQLRGSDVDKGKYLPTKSLCEEAQPKLQPLLRNCRCEEAQPTWQSPASSIWVQQQCEEYSSHGLIVYKKDKSEPKSESKSEHKFSAKVFNSDGSDGQFSGNGMRCLAHHIFCENKDLCKILIKMGNNKNYHKALKEKEKKIEQESEIYKTKIITYHKLLNSRSYELSINFYKSICTLFFVLRPGLHQNILIMQSLYMLLKASKLQNTKLLFNFKTIDFRCAIIPMDAIGIFIDVGNPHILINSEKPNSQFLGYVKDLQTKDSSFLDFNISQYKKISKNKFELLTFERGVGPTPACTSAALALCNYLNIFSESGFKTIEIIMPGGCLKAELMGDKVKFCAGVDVE
jgi:diaminopimelate epimerase